jgi:hypothetical protein
MISIQEILNQEAWPTPETPGSDKKRKFDAIIIDSEDPYDDYDLGHEECLDEENENDDPEQAEEEDYEPEEVTVEARDNNMSFIRHDPFNATASTFTEQSLTEEVSKIAQDLKEPQEHEHDTVQQVDPPRAAQPPRKRQRLSNIAVGVGCFIAGSVSTVAALASLPDKFFS